jgi:hypothetical protein
MKKVSTILFCLAILATSMIAQERTGNITGTVLDKEGNPLPGVTLTLSGPKVAPSPAVSNAEGKFRFLSLAPSKDYEIKAELQGFKTRTETGFVVNVNVTADVKIVMEQGKLEEQVTVVAVTPVVQVKKTQVTTTVNYDQLQSLPSARDPWVVLQLAPSVFIDRENIGGVESGQQSSFMSKGSTTQEWTLDGMQITDRNSGGSPGYFDFDSFEEMNISTGMLDVEHRDPGTVVNLVTRRGGNKTSIGGRFFYTNEKFQATITPADLTSMGIQGYNHAVDLKDFGFNVGGPFLKDKVWWWVAYGVQQVQTINLLNVRDDTYLNNYTGKVNFQLIPENRLELFYQAGDKKKYGRSSSNSFPPGWNQHSDYYFGNPTFKLQDEHMIGDNLFLSIRYGWANAGFGMWPANDESLKNYMWYDYQNDLVTQSYTYFYSDRPHPYFVGQVQFFADNLFGTGTAHEIKLGGEINNTSRTYTGGYPGNFYVYSNYNTETVDWNLDGKVDVVKNLAGAPTFSRIYLSQNDLAFQDGTKRLAFYGSDAITVGRFNINIGLRADWAKPWLDPRTMTALWTKNGTDKYRQYYNDIALKLFTPDALAAVASTFPTKSQPGVTPIKLFWFFSPRVGLTYDVFGDGKTVFKIAYTLYPGGGLGNAYTTPFGVTGRSMNFWWADINADKKASLNELYWASYASTARPVYRAFNDDGSFAGNWTREKGYNWNGWLENDPLAISKSATYIDLDNWKTSLTHEFFISVEREIMQDFGASASFSWRRMGRYSWTLAYYPQEFFATLNNHLRSKDDYQLAGYIPTVLTDPATGATLDPKQAAGKPWYVLKYIAETGTTSYSKTVMMDPGRHDRYWGIDVVLNKRLSHKWMMNGSFTYQMQNSFYGDNGAGYGPDPTNLWAYEGQVYGVSMGGTSGKVARLMFSRWMFKLTGLYQLPWDLNASFTISGHEGSFVSYSFGVQDRTLPNPQSYSNTIQMTTYDNKTRLPNVWTISAKIEKAIRLGDTGRIYFSADVFNLINSRVLMRQYDYAYGSYRFTGSPDNPVPYSWTAGATTSGAKNEIMNPLLLRLGVRFQI